MRTFLYFSRSSPFPPALSILYFCVKKCRRKETAVAAASRPFPAASLGPIHPRGPPRSSRPLSLRHSQGPSLILTLARSIPRSPLDFPLPRLPPPHRRNASKRSFSRSSSSRQHRLSPRPYSPPCHEPSSRARSPLPSILLVHHAQERDLDLISSPRALLSCPLSGPPPH